MKINLSFPATGCQKLIEIADELKVRPFYEKRMGQEVDVDTLGDEFKGYVCRITGGQSLLLSIAACPFCLSNFVLSLPASISNLTFTVFKVIPTSPPLLYPSLPPSHIN